MYYCNKKTKVIHKRNCTYSKKMKKQNLIKKEDIRSLFNEGYRFCEHCASIKKELNKEKVEIEVFCKNKRIAYCVTDSHLVIQTPFGVWRITPSHNSSGYNLWHQNGKISRIAQSFEHFHFQKYFCKHLLSVFKYIETHDIYREQVPFGIQAPRINPNLHKGSKKYKKQQKQIAKYEAKRDRINQTNIVLFLLDQIIKTRQTVD